MKNSFQIFKCFKNGKFLKANEGFYISLCSLSIQSVSFLLYIVLNPKLAFLATLANPTKKNSTDKKQKDNKKAEESGEIINKKEEMGKDEIKEIQKKNACKKESNVINYGNIGEDLNEKFSNNEGDNNTNFHCREGNEIKLDTIKIENKANFKLERNLSRKSVSEDGKNVDETDELNKNSKLANLNTIINKLNANNTNTNTNTNANTLAYIATVEENNKQKEVSDIEDFSLQGYSSTVRPYKDQNNEMPKYIRTLPIINGIEYRNDSRDNYLIYMEV